MTMIAILPENPGSPGTSYRAIAGNKQSVGKTAGEALDALTSQLGDGGATALVVLQRSQPDGYFTTEQQRRLEELMGRWRQARDLGKPLSPEEQTELDALVQAELRAATARAGELLQGLSS